MGLHANDIKIPLVIIYYYKDFFSAFNPENQPNKSQNRPKLLVLMQFNCL